MQERFGDAEVRGRRDGQKLGQAFNDAEDGGEQVIVHGGAGDPFRPGGSVVYSIQAA